MNKLLVILGLLGAGVLSTLALAQVEVGPREKPPEIDPGEEPRPVTPPSDGRQVAVLDIRLMLADGKVRSAQVVEARRINSIAPKVFQRQGGDWEVRINGSEEDAFYVFSPIYLEAETEERDRNPFTYVEQDGAVNWSLVVPLYRGKRTIKAESILVIDRSTGRPIMEANF
jgi:hypothetical protein